MTRMRVTISGSTISMPYLCACCGATPECSHDATVSKEKGVKVIRTQTKGWPIPYCRRCLSHVEISPVGIGKWTIVLSIVTMGWWIPVYLVYYLVAWFWAKSHVRAECISMKASVEYLGWQGSVHEFDVRSEPFAFALMQANERKLLNVDYASRQALLSAMSEFRCDGNSAPPIPPAPKHLRADVPPRSQSPVPQQTRVEMEDDASYVRAVADLERARGPASRRAVLESWVARMSSEQHRVRLTIEAARIEVRAVLDKVDGLKTVQAKRRHLIGALESIRADDIPDVIQQKEIAMLEEALASLESTGSG